MANRFRKLTEEKREQLFQAFCEKQSLVYIAKKCSVTVTTCLKYRKEDKWEKRFDEIREKALHKVDNKTAAHIARHIKLGQVLQQAGADYYIDKRTGKIKENAIEENRDATVAIVQGVRIEREAMGIEDGKGNQPIQIQVQFVNVNAPAPIVRGNDIDDTANQSADL